MKAATQPRDHQATQKLLAILPEGMVSTHFHTLPDFLNPGDLLVVNDAATFPASLRGNTLSGEPIEVRLLPKAPGQIHWEAILFGTGDWRTRTEDRALPPLLKIGDLLIFDPNFKAVVEKVSPHSSRWLEIRFNLDETETWKEIYRHGKPIQYSYLKDELSLWSVQTFYSARPWASEMPSAGKPLNWQIFSQLLKKGVQIATLTHATGLSSTGDPALDRLLPFPEFYWIPEETVQAVTQTQEKGHRIIAVGTSVVRALESQALRNQGQLVAGTGRTELVISPPFHPKIIDGILTRIHEVGESHFRLLEVFSERSTLEKALELAEDQGFLAHEFGDSALILRAG